MTISDAPNCSDTYDRHYDNRNSFIIQANGQRSSLFSRSVSVSSSDLLKEKLVGIFVSVRACVIKMF